MNKSIKSTFERIRKTQISRMRYVDQRISIYKELLKLYNRGVGVGKRFKKRIECKEHFLGFFDYPYEIVHFQLPEDHPIYDKLIEEYRKNKEMVWFDFCPYCGIKLDKGKVAK